MAFSYHDLTSHSAGLVPHQQASGWVVAVSGGLDSMCLLHALVQLRKHQSCPPMRVVHINHGLHADASSWQQQVELQSQQYGLQCISRVIHITADAQRKLGLESAARNARYEVFSALLQQDEVLLLAQHADDQSETLLLRLLRGAGVAGLRAMPQERNLAQGRLHRPLLHVRQPALIEYAQQQHLSWCEDPSNQSLAFDRNFLRHQITPILRQRWPTMDRRLATTAAIMDDTQRLLQQVAAEDLALIVGLSDESKRLPMVPLLALTIERRHNLLRYWLAQQRVPAADHALMQRIDTELLSSARDGQPCLVLGDWCLRRHDGQLLLLPWQRLQNSPAPEHDQPQSNWQVKFTPQHVSAQQIELPLGRLCYGHAAVALGLAVDDQLEVRQRVGGERCKPVGRQHSQSLKKLLQEAKVASWQRQQLPLFFVNGELAMVANLWVNSGFEVKSKECGWHWQKPA